MTSIVPQRPRRCMACPYRSKTVGNRGNSLGHLIIIGEAPGIVETQSGQPFVGPSGILLNDTLAKVGINQDDVLFTNALQCMPDIGIGPNVGSIDACRPRVLRECQGKSLVVAMGRVALESLTSRKLKITHERGKVRWVDSVGYVLPIMHPAAILRAPGMYNQFVRDFAYAKDILDNPANIRNPGVTRYIVADSVDKFDTLIAGLKRCKVVGADIETTSLDPTEGTILSLGIAWDKNKVIVFPDTCFRDSYMHMRLGEVLLSPDIRWVWHNGKYDTSFLVNAGLPARVDEDTMLMNYALDERKGIHSLEQMSSDRLGAEDYKDAVSPFLKSSSDTFGNIPPEVLYKRMAQDADYTLQLYHVLLEELQSQPGPFRAYRKLMIPASNFLRWVESNGLLIDDVEIQALRLRLEEKAQYLLGLLQQFVHRIQDDGYPLWDADLYKRTNKRKTAPDVFNPNSPLQVSHIIYGRLRLSPEHESKEFRHSTDEPDLMMLPRHEFINLLLEYRGTLKLLNTYVMGTLRKLNRDGRIRSTYLIHGTVTGRLSSQQPNVQNIPRDDSIGIKKIYRAAPNYVFAEFDYKQAELCVLASLSKDPTLIQVYRDNKDLHGETARLIWGDDYTSLQRGFAKTINFGIIYGLTPESVQNRLGCTLIQAQAMVRGWADGYPVAWRYLQYLKAMPRSREYNETLFGRRRRFGLVNRKNQSKLGNESCNFPIQSIASDLTLLSGIAMQRKLIEYDVRIVNIVHDALSMEIPEHMIDVVVPYVQKVMSEIPKLALGDTVPFRVDVKLGESWGNAKHIEVNVA